MRSTGIRVPPSEERHVTEVALGAREGLGSRQQPPPAGAARGAMFGECTVRRPRDSCPEAVTVRKKASYASRRQRMTHVSRCHALGEATPPCRCAKPQRASATLPDTQTVRGGGDEGRSSSWRDKRSREPTAPERWASRANCTSDEPQRRYPRECLRQAECSARESAGAQRRRAAKTRQASYAQPPPPHARRSEPAPTAAKPAEVHVFM